MDPWFGINPQGIGVIGMLINFAVVAALLPFFPPPSPRVMRMIDQIREPEDVLLKR
jgi:cation/acetate symporter